MLLIAAYVGGMALKAEFTYLRSVHAGHHRETMGVFPERRRGLSAANDDPQHFFHIAKAYAILRHNGVDVGKMDFLGPINLVDD